MKKLLFVAVAAALLCSVNAAQAADTLRHVVCFKFKSTAAPADIKKVETAFAGLKQKIKQVQQLEWGTNVSKEQKDKGFTHCFFLSFKSEKDRDAYIEHPAHKAFVGIVGPVVEDVFVIDYWAKK